MAAGDASKTWFDEVIQHMIDNWSSNLSWDDVIGLCEKLTQIRDKIREDRNIKPPMFLCEKCDSKHPMVLAPVKISAMLFALQKAGVIMPDAYDLLLKEWLKFQRKNKLDAFGKIKPSKPKKKSIKVENNNEKRVYH